MLYTGMAWAGVAWRVISFCGMLRGKCGGNERECAENAGEWCGGGVGGIWWRGWFGAWVVGGVGGWGRGWNVKIFRWGVLGCDWGVVGVFWAWCGG